MFDLGERYSFQDVDGLTGEGILVALGDLWASVRVDKVVNGKHKAETYLGIDWAVPPKKLEPASKRKTPLYPQVTNTHEALKADLQPVPKPDADPFAETDPPPELMCRRDGPGVSEHQRRKGQPLFRGVLASFPDALAAIAHLAVTGNQQHNPGLPLHWSFDKSTDHGDCILRHQADYDERDTDDEWHATKVAMRGLMQLQTWLEKQDPELHARRQAQRDRAAKGER